MGIFSVRSVVLKTVIVLNQSKSVGLENLRATTSTSHETLSRDTSVKDLYDVKMDWDGGVKQCHCVRPCLYSYLYLKI